VRARVALLWVLWPAAAAAQDSGDYDPASTAWNGLSSLVELARAEGVALEPANVVAFRTLRPRDALLVVYPEEPLPVDDILRFLSAGGRVAVADDFGTAGALLERLEIRRSDGPPDSVDTLNGNRELPIARPRAAHPLSEGVDALVANHPTYLTATGEKPVLPAFDFGTPMQAAVIAGGATGGTGTGRIAVLSDPSVLINNMLEHPGNRRFAKNLLHYLGAAGGRVVLAHGAFTSIGSLGTPPSLSSPEIIPAFNSFLRDLASVSPPEPVVRMFALLAIVATFLGIAVGVPLAGHRYDGRWLRPGYRAAAAGFLGKVEIFRGRKASYLYPALVLRRDLEVRLVEALGLAAPVTVDAIVDALAKRGVRPESRVELRRLLEALDRLQVRADRGSVPPRVSAKRLGRLAESAERMLGLAAGMRRPGER
jgi:hypothetical protein